jgi:general secretion pathway protein C
MPRQIHILFNLLALFVIIYIVVDTFYRVVSIQLHQVSGQTVVMLKDVESQAAKPLTTPDYDMIVERNIFGATEKTEPLPVEEEPIETLEETSLQLSLLGTIAGDSESARAIILDQKKKSQDIYRVGDSVQGAEIRQILRGKVVLRHGEKDEILTMVEGDDKPHATAKVDSRSKLPSRGGSRGRVRARPAPQAAGSELGDISGAREDTGGVEEEIIPIAQDVLQSSISNRNQLMTEVRVRPYFRQGKPEGLIVSQIQADSVFEQLGLLNGDIISSVNGKKISSPEQAFQLYNSLKQGSQVSIAITRRGQKKMLTYEIR